MGSVPERGRTVADRLRQTIQRGFDARADVLSPAQSFARVGELQHDAGFGADLELDGKVEILAPQQAKRFRGAIKLARVQKLAAPESGDRQDFIGASGEAQQIGSGRA